MKLVTGLKFMSKAWIIDSDHTIKYQNRPERLAKDKRCSLFGLFVDDED